MPPAKSTDPLPAEQNLSSAREILELQNVYPLTSKSLDRARKAALLRNHPDKCLDGEPLHTCDAILNAYELLKQEAEEGDLHAQMNEDRLEKIKLTFGQWFCTSECQECLATATRRSLLTAWGQGSGFGSTDTMPHLGVAVRRPGEEVGDQYFSTGVETFN